MVAHPLFRPPAHSQKSSKLDTRAGRFAHRQLLSADVVRGQDAGGAADKLDGDAQQSGDDGRVEACPAQPAGQ